MCLKVPEMKCCMFEICDVKTFGIMIDDILVLSVPDICSILEITEGLFHRHANEEDFLKGSENRWIEESGFYKTLFRLGDKVDSKFLNWICIEVLPTIRKTGGYIRVRGE